jgi:hypothetical protein
MPSDDVLKAGTSITLQISLDPVTYAGLRRRRLHARLRVVAGVSRPLPERRRHRRDRQDHHPVARRRRPRLRQAAGRHLPLDGLRGRRPDLRPARRGVADPAITLDVFAYDLNEPDLVARLEQLGPRLRIIVDDSTDKSKTTGAITGHGTAAATRARRRRGSR